ncbi:hypothetical protein EJ08DRAFT_675148 [Tothia fuscella]|uniref:Uncharacterized protein n=1 Tax=Tothia fuscella TaxID=1048955 RepID=A0A9P4P280_9PEZI|nr:hypothetical protein EJ08DRAFT_675148 [Tothia fuscella]
MNSPSDHKSPLIDREYLHQSHTEEMQRSSYFAPHSTPSPSTPCTIASDSIIITDVGIGKKYDAWYWLMLGCHVYDHEFEEVNLERLEQEIDLNGARDPFLIRGEVWKAVGTRYWQRDDRSKFGPMPAQPGLTPPYAEEFFAWRRANCKRHRRHALHHENSSPSVESGLTVACLEENLSRDSFQNSRTAQRKQPENEQLISSTDATITCICALSRREHTSKAPSNSSRVTSPSSEPPPVTRTRLDSGYSSNSLNTD